MKGGTKSNKIMAWNAKHATIITGYLLELKRLTCSSVQIPFMLIRMKICILQLFVIYLYMRIFTLSSYIKVKCFNKEVTYNLLKQL